ncbi:MAG: recombination mediator RecR [Myxococcota bacterium]|nr:recombination mediator RecR [Myxococcota bacterium]
MTELLTPIERVVSALRRLPGVGEKTATRLAYFLLAAPEPVAQDLAEAIVRLRSDVVICERCFTLSEQSPCPICTDENRQRRQVCVVEEPADLASIEKAGNFTGLYHVLGGTLSPLDGIGPDALRIGPLLERVRAGEVDEIILATNPNPEGEATALFVAEQLRDSAVLITRIGFGMPLGGDLEYIDRVTVRRSLENRRAFGA